MAYPQSPNPLAPAFENITIPPDFVMHEDGEWYFFWPGFYQGDPSFVEKVPKQYQAKLNEIFGSWSNQ